MRVSILRNPGKDLLTSLKIDEAQAATLTEGAQVDVPDEIGTALSKAGVAGPPEIRGVPPQRDTIQGNQNQQGGGNRGNQKGGDSKDQK